MIVTQLEKFQKSKFRIYLDEEFAFVLSQKELDYYGIADGTELSDERYYRIMKDTVLEKAKQKTISILSFRDRSEYELRKKLSESGFPPEIVNQVLNYVYEYGYVNDQRFASNYIKGNKYIKSKLIIINELKKKGIEKELIEQVMSEEYFDQEEEPELTAIHNAIAKKVSDPEQLTYEEKQKLITSLYRKGFELSKIRKIIR